MSLLSRGLAKLASGLAVGAGVSITYARGATSIAATAWVGRTVFSQLPTAQGGAAIVFGDRDYLIPVAALASLANPDTPQRGDRIAETVNGEACVFEVVAPGGEPPWRFSDPGRTIYWVHTKRVS